MIMSKINISILQTFLMLTACSGSVYKSKKEIEISKKTDLLTEGWFKEHYFSCEIKQLIKVYYDFLILNIN